MTNIKGTLYVMCRLEVDRVCDSDEAASILGTTDLWEADDHIVATHPAPKHFGLAVPLETMQRLQFVSGNTTKPLTFKSSTELDQQTLRNVRELHPDSATELDKLLAPIDGP